MKMTIESQTIDDRQLAPEVVERECRPDQVQAAAERIAREIADEGRGAYRLRLLVDGQVRVEFRTTRLSDVTRAKAIAEAQSDEGRLADLAAAGQAACVKFGEIERQLKAEFEALTARREQLLGAAQSTWSEAERLHKAAKTSAGRLPGLRNQVQAIRTAAISG